MRKKSLALLLVLTMLATMFVGVLPASAQSVNAVSVVKSVADDFTGLASSVTIQEHSDWTAQFTAGQTFRLTLPSGIKWDAATWTASFTPNGGAAVDLKAGGQAVLRSDQVLEVTTPAGVTANKDVFEIGLGIEVDGATGDLSVTVDPMDSTVTGGTYVFARVGSGKTTAVCESVKTIGQSGVGGVIRIDEAYVDSMGNAAQTVTLKLPSNFEWNGMAAADVVAAGDFAPWGAAVVVAGNNTRTLTLTIDPANTSAQRGTIYITPRIKAASGAAKGDVSVTVSGDNVTETDVVAAKYADWGIELKVAEVKDILAGKFDDTTTKKITIEEMVPGSLVQDRITKVSFPDWVKVTRMKGADWSVSGGGLAVVAGVPVPDGTKSYVEFTVTTGSTLTAGKVEFTADFSIEGNKGGNDIEMTITSPGVEEQKLVVAKAIAPAEATATSTDVKIGVQNQEASDIVIKEVIGETWELTAESTAAGEAGVIKLTAPSGVKFAATPTVAVTAGDVEIKTAEVRLSDSDTVVNIPIKSESVKPSEIKVSGVKLTLDRTVPEGDLFIKVGGNAIIENSISSIGWVNGATAGGAGTTLDAGEFTTGTAVKVKVGNCVTPAPGEIINNVVFGIGKSTYTVNGAEKTMDVAPYISNDRTYMPVRYVGNALGIDDANILWDASNQTATFMKGDKVVQVKIGSNTMLVNGVAIAMDTAPEIKDGRTMMSLYWIGKAFGATFTYDAATQTVTMGF